MFVYEARSRPRSFEAAANLKVDDIENFDCKSTAERRSNDLQEGRFCHRAPSLYALQFIDTITSPGVLHSRQRRRFWPIDDLGILFCSLHG